jgi:hypothetical protein
MGFWAARLSAAEDADRKGKEDKVKGLLELFDREFYATRLKVLDFAKSIHAFGQKAGVRHPYYDRAWTRWFKEQKEYNRTRDADETDKKKAAELAKKEPGSLTMHRRIVEGIDGPLDTVFGYCPLGVSWQVAVILILAAVPAYYLVTWAARITDRLVGQRGIAKRAELAASIMRALEKGLITPAEARAQWLAAFGDDLGPSAEKGGGVFALPRLPVGKLPLILAGVAVVGLGGVLWWRRSRRRRR